VATRQRDRGAAAVEMAIVLPMLLLMIGGLIDFGRAYFTKIVITNAAREGARAAVVNADPYGRAAAAATGVSIVTPVTVAYTPSATDCVSATSGTDVMVTVTTTTFTWIILQPALSLFGASGALPGSLSATANMRCE
jgi:Flp pilus assembly protein TadG